MKAEPAGPGCIRVTTPDGRHEIVYVAGLPGQRWAFWKGQVVREPTSQPAASGRRRSTGTPPVTAPMPATVLKVLVAPGQQVDKGTTVVIVEAMKMELPLRAESDATVTAVRCREGELVAPDAVLVEFAAPTRDRSDGT
jgi:biotin carboxyl carrier protein